jgi:hypothetical protein
MSAARSRHRDIAAGGSPGPEAGPARRNPGGRRLLLVTVVLAVGWSLLLLAMDFWAIARIVVGPGQILKSDVVVIGRRIAAGQNDVEVERVFKGDADEGATLRVVNLAEAPRIAAGPSYIFALTRFRGDFMVTRLDGQRANADLLIYPATPATIEQTKAILREGD